MKKSKKNKIIQDILDSITPEEQIKIDKNIEKHIEYLDAHPNYNLYYGTIKSYFLQDVISKGIKPIGITVMMCEETLIYETQEELDKSWELFKPEGFHYLKENWEQVRKQYVDDIYNGVDDDAPTVFWLNK